MASGKSPELRLPFKSAVFGAAYTNLAVGNTATFTKEDCGFYIPEGYEFFAISAFTSGSMYVNISTFDPFSDERFITVRNYKANNNYDSSASGTARIRVTFINSEFKEAYMQPNN